MGAKSLSLSQSKEYLKTIMNLEISCYEQEKIVGRLKESVASAERIVQETEADAKSKPEGGSAVGIVISIIFSLFISAIVTIIGGAVGGAAWFIYSFFGWIFGFSDGSFHWLWLVIPASIGCAGALIFLVVTTIIGSRDVNRDEWHKYNTAVQSLDHKKEIANQYAETYQKSIEQLEETKSLLKQYYNEGFLYPKYRSVVPVATIYEYLDSGRCFTLYGHEGAYNLYENELRMNMILEKLDDIIYRLDDISSSQRVLAQLLKESNRKIDSLKVSLKNIETSTELTQYYSQISAANTSYLAWLAYIEH